MVDLTTRKTSSKAEGRKSLERKSLKRGAAPLPNEGRPVAKFEIVRPSPASDYWSRLGLIVAPLADAARTALGEAYASVAKVVVERIENFEDSRAESKARQRIAGRTVTAGGRAPQTRLIETANRKKRRVSPSQQND